MAFHWIEVPIAVQNLMMVQDAPGSDDYVDGLADRHAACAERAVVERAAQGHFPSHQFAALKQGEHSGGTIELRLRAKPLQHLDQNQVTEQNGFAVQKSVEDRGFRSIVAI